MKTKYIFICDSTEIKNGNKLNAYGVFDVVQVNKLPATQKEMVIVANVEIEAEEREKEYTERLEISKEGSLIASSESPFTPTSARQGFLHHLKNITFTTDGIYEIKILINGLLIAQTDLHVIKNI